MLDDFPSVFIFLPLSRQTVKLHHCRLQLNYISVVCSYKLANKDAVPCADIYVTVPPVTEDNRPNGACAVGRLDHMLACKLDMRLLDLDVR